MKEPERNYDIAIKSAITAKQTAYDNWKKNLIKSLQCSFIDNDGNMAYIRNDYKKRATEACDAFMQASQKLDELRKEQANDKT